MSALFRFALLTCNEDLCPYYRGIWDQCKKLRQRHLIHQYHTISGTVRVKVEKNGSPKFITHMVDLEQLFPEADIINLSWIYNWALNAPLARTSHYSWHSP